MAETPAKEAVQPLSPLLASAYDFVEHSLDVADSATEEPRLWKFAIINIATAVELFLKERLRREHPVLIYTKVDDGSGHTVSMDVALKRLRVCNVTFDADDVSRLNRARDMRNAIVHFSTQASSEQLRSAYVDLFEFAHVFHEKELGEELHDEIGEVYWPAEAAFIEEFKREYISYHGDTVHRGWPSLLVDAQFYTHLVVDGTPFKRIPYGDEREGWSTLPQWPCRDCAALHGQLHGPDCDNERCPKCGGQALFDDCGEVYEWGSWPDAGETSIEATAGTSTVPIQASPEDVTSPESTERAGLASDEAKPISGLAAPRPSPGFETATDDTRQ
ncbi:hypothetical protein ABZU92_29470 [Micromonospora arida]|uniref:hypothetical protein n=1 Tax=Micromonospora arida TaxID=2203715 RepID=UPI0033A25775